MTSISLILPTRDDVGYLLEIVSEVQRHSTPVEIIIVDSASHLTNSREIQKVRSSFDHNPPIVINSSIGLGAALQAGYSQASGEIIGWFPTDNQMSVQVLKSLLTNCRPTKFVYAARMGYRESNTRLRSWLSQIDKVIVRRLMSMIDSEFSGVYLCPRTLIDNLPFEYSTAAINWSLADLAVKAGLTIEGIEAIIQPRLNGRSRISLREMVHYPTELLRYAFIFR